MTYERFEDLPVWQEAMRLAHGVYDLTENPRFKISFSLCDQIERSSMSVSDNIAEGFERGTTSEFARIHLYRACLGWRNALQALPHGEAAASSQFQI